MKIRIKERKWKLNKSENKNEMEITIKERG